MAPVSPVILILGSGPNIGANVAKKFAADGYRVALAARKSPAESNASYKYIIGDLSEPSSVHDIFTQVRESLGQPSVVVYNAGAVSPTAKEDPYHLDLSQFQTDFNINTVSMFVAIKEALASFAALPETAARTFIYTGNAMNFASFPGIMTLGAGKSASAHLISAAAAAYAPRGFKFYYADERQADGKLAGRGISGEAHATLYKTLSEEKTQGPWLQTFVNGKGYVSFAPDTQVTF